MWDNQAKAARGISMKIYNAIGFAILALSLAASAAHLVYLIGLTALGFVLAQRSYRRRLVT